MNQHTFHLSKEPDRGFGQCHFHPNEIFVGVCPLCLNERLLTLASLKQSHYNKHRSQQHSTTSTSRGHSFSLTTKFLGLGSILNRLELRNNYKTSSSFYGDRDYNSGSSTSSQEDSFISIKFEENGVAFWDKGNKTDDNERTKRINNDSSEQRRNTKHLNLLVETNVNKSSNRYKTVKTSVTERTKPQGGTYPWRKRIGHMFDQIRWKTVSNTNMVH